MPISQPITSGVRDRRLPMSHATTRPNPKSQASTLAIAAIAHATPAQKPCFGVSQIPNRTSAIPIGSAMPAVSLKIATGERAANVPATAATAVPQ